MSVLALRKHAPSPIASRRAVALRWQMQHVLMVTPTARSAERWSAALRDEGFGVARATDAIDGMREAEATDVSAVVLDVAALGADGLALLMRLRDCGYRALLLAVEPARDADAAIRSIDVGADGVADEDCSPRALAIRLRALIRRARPTDEPNGGIQLGRLHVDVDARCVWRGDRRIDLRPREFDLLLALLRERGCAVDAARLVAGRGGDSLVRVYIHALRRKLGNAGGGPRCIVTVRGNGYMIPRSTNGPAGGTA